MQIYIDSANIAEIKEAISWGIVDGITTNPSLIRKAAEERKIRSMKTYIQSIMKEADSRPVSLEVTALKKKDIICQAKKLYDLFLQYGRPVIKIPVNPAKKVGNKTRFDALEAICELDSEDIPVNATLVMTVGQAVLAAKAGARYVSPFAGRIDDYLTELFLKGSLRTKVGYFAAEGITKEGELCSDRGIVSGVDLVGKIVKVFREYRLETEIIAASIRNERQVTEIAMTGVDIATIPFRVIEWMIGHPKTYEGVKTFANDTIPEYEAMLK